jgi:hypothetical protein
VSSKIDGDKPEREKGKRKGERKRRRGRYASISRLERDGHESRGDETKAKRETEESEET